MATRQVATLSSAYICERNQDIIGGYCALHHLYVESAAVLYLSARGLESRAATTGQRHWSSSRHRLGRGNINTALAISGGGGEHERVIGCAGISAKAQLRGSRWQPRRPSHQAPLMGPTAIPPPRAKPRIASICSAFPTRQSRGWCRHPGLSGSASWHRSTSISETRPGP